MLEVHGLTLQIDGVMILNDVSFKLSPGQTLAILGETGSGKSSLLRCLLGSEAPTHGTIVFQDCDLTNKPVHDRQIGYVPQEGGVFPVMTARGNIAVRDGNKQKIDEVAKQLGISHLLDRVGGFSGGERKRIMMARVLSQEKPLVLLDEPFSSLDTPRRKEVRKIFKDYFSENRAGNAIIVTHDVEDLDGVGADMVGVLSQGTLVEFGSYAKVRKDSKNPLVHDLLRLGG